MSNKKSIQALLDNENLWQEIYDVFGDSGGTYRLFSKKGKDVLSVDRIVKPDIQGTLYIGHATAFTTRVIDLKTTISENYNSSAHVSGRRYHLPNRTALREKYPIATLWLEMVGYENPKTAEKDLLDRYIREFGESPPLNAMDY